GPAGDGTPDGTTKPPTTDTNSGIAVGVAVTVAVVNTKAYIAKNAVVNAASLTIDSKAPGADKSSYTSSATSGAGGTGSGGGLVLAGAIGVNVVVSNTTADVEGADPVAVNGDLTLNALSSLESDAAAKAKQDGDGKASGVGASVAVNVVNDTTTAGLADNSVTDGALNGVHDLTITATSTDAMTTTAEGGASTGSGSVSLAAQAAIAISNVTTTASVGAGAPLTITGKLVAHATQNVKTTTKASGDTKGGNAAIGLSLALLVANHDVESTLERDLTAGGVVSFTADGSSANDTEATASSTGADEKKSSNPGDTDASNKDVNGKADANLDVAKSKDSSGKTASTSTPPAKSGESGGTKVTVAAAVSIGIIVTTTGALSLASSANTDSKVVTNASAVKAKTANIGAAVSINRLTIDNESVVGVNDLINSDGLGLTASMRNVGGDQKHSIDTLATSGAGEGKVGIAGALALTIADVTTNAEIHANSGRGPPGDQLGLQDLTLSATATVESTAKAVAKDKDAGTVGIGAGVAINIVDVTTIASIDSGAVIDDGTGATPGERPKDVTLTATGKSTMLTHAEAGTDGKSGSDLALTPTVAISYPTVTTTTRIL